MKMRMMVLMISLGMFTGQSFAQKLKLAYSQPYGLSLIRYGDQTLLDFNNQKGRAFGPEVFKLITKDNKVVSEWSHIQSQQWDDAKKQYTVTFIWGTASVKYKQVADTLQMAITLTNTTKSDTFCGMSFCPLAFEFGKRPTNFQASFPYTTNNINSPGVIRANMPGYSIILENPDPGKKVYIGFLEENNTNGSLYRIWNGNIPYNGMGGFNPEVELRLSPGKSFSYNMAIKFVTPEAPVALAASGAYSNFRKAKPFKIRWTDKRPIGTLFLSSFTGQKYPENPRNWSMMPVSEINTTTIAGRRALKSYTLEYARRSIGNLKMMDAQGMITWDIEGQEYPHPLSYIGSPELLEKVAPEMNQVADEYFAMFTRAGLKTGICIRPDSVIFHNNNTWIDHIAVKDPLATMTRKIKYAQKRWGCSIFYIDSNLDPAGQLMDPAIFEKLNSIFPDILLIPEHERVPYYAFTAPFSDLKFENILLDQEIKSAYPDAFMVINVPEGLKESSENNVNNLVKSLQQGNILLFRAWYTDEPTNTWIRQAMKKYKQQKGRY